MATSTPVQECLLTIGGTTFLLPQDNAAIVFKLMHGATALDSTYKDGKSGWKYATYNTEVQLKHASENIRATLVLAE